MDGAASPRPRIERPVVIPPLTPSELMQRVVSRRARPATVVICWPREAFVDALTQDISLQHRREDDHPLLRASLAQTVSARHAAVVFAPSVRHLRAWAATWTPGHDDDDAAAAQPRLLVVYGLLELHRHDADWSAQALGTSAAVLVEAAGRSGSRAVLTEPRTEGVLEPDGGDCAMRELRRLLTDEMPILAGSHARRHDSSAGPVVRVAHVLADWFVVDDKADM